MIIQSYKIKNEELSVNFKLELLKAFKQVKVDIRLSNLGLLINSSLIPTNWDFWESDKNKSTSTIFSGSTFVY